MKKWQTALSRGVFYFPDNHSTCKWLSILSTAVTFGPCVGRNGCPRQPEQTLHPRPGLSLCPAFTPPVSAQHMLALVEPQGTSPRSAALLTVR